MPELERQRDECGRDEHASRGEHFQRPAHRGPQGCRRIPDGRPDRAPHGTPCGRRRGMTRGLPFFTHIASWVLAIRPAVRPCLQRCKALCEQSVRPRYAAARAPLRPALGVHPLTTETVRRRLQCVLPPYCGARAGISSSSSPSSSSSSPPPKLPAPPPKFWARGKGSSQGGEKRNSRPAPCSGPQRCRARPHTGAPTPRPLSASQCGRPSTWWRLCGAYPAAAPWGSQPPSPSCTGSAPAARPAATCRTHPWGHLVAGQPGSDGAHSARRGPHPNTTEAASVVTTTTYPSPPPPPRPRPCTWPSPP